MDRKHLLRKKRHQRIRNVVCGTGSRPRLCVYRSLCNIYAQVIDDSEGKTLVACSTLDKEVKPLIKGGGNKDAAKVVGQIVANRAKELGISAVVFDRGGFQYHGRIAALADGAREAGLTL